MLCSAVRCLVSPWTLHLFGMISASPPSAAQSGFPLCPEPGRSPPAHTCTHILKQLSQYVVFKTPITTISGQQLCSCMYHRGVWQLTFCCSCCRGNCLVWCLGEWYQTGGYVSEPSTGDRCTDGPLRSSTSQWCPDEDISIQSEVINMNYTEEATNWSMLFTLHTVPAKINTSLKEASRSTETDV